jgi:hypothetical protein
MRTLSRRAALIQITLSLLWILGTGCSRPVPLPTPTPTATSIFRSEQFHLEVTLPPGWSAAEGPEYLAHPFTGLVAFNSWGEAGFWAPEVTTANGSTYGPESVLSQIPGGGAYIVLVLLSGGPPPEQYGPEYERDDLSDFWKARDCREPGTRPAGFFKWGRYLTLEVYCKPDVSDATAEAMTRLLASWRFDHVPVGDVGWAVVKARALLPSSVEPSKFPIPTARSRSEGPTRSTEQSGAAVRTTEVQLQGETVGVKFNYCWGEAPMRVDTTPAEQCHWWRYEAGPSGEVLLVEEGGAALPTFGQPTTATKPGR